jgi:PAS domain-containing protein
VSLQDANRQVRDAEAKYHALFNSIDEGFCVIEVLFDDANQPVDYRFLEVNPAFEKQTGIANSVGGCARSRRTMRSTGSRHMGRLL